MPKPITEFTVDQIADAVSAHCREQGINHHMLAKRLGWSRNRLARRLNNPQNLTLAEAADLFMALGFGAHLRFLPRKAMTEPRDDRFWNENEQTGEPKQEIEDELWKTPENLNTRKPSTTNTLQTSPQPTDSQDP